MAKKSRRGRDDERPDERDVRRGSRDARDDRRGNGRWDEDGDRWDEHDDRWDEHDDYGDERDGYAARDADGYDDRPPASSQSRALTVRGADDERAVALPTQAAAAPVVIRGSGVSMGNPFIRRRERPLTMRLAITTLIACIVVTGLISITPVGADGISTLSGFEALAGGIVMHRTPGYTWYKTQPGDTPESIAARFHVQVGGIYEMNTNLPVGQDLAVGINIKIPDDPFYGENYRAPDSLLTKTTSSTTFGTDWWNSYAGSPPPGAPCAPDGHGNPQGYHLQSPNWGSSWVRGYTWAHNGVDIAAAYGNPIRAAQYGEVIWSGWTNTGFGYSIVINHCWGLTTLYGHMSKLIAKAGDYVHPGDIIGLEGETGWATGPHLHLSVLVHGQFVDPMAYYPSIYALTHAP